MKETLTKYAEMALNWLETGAGFLQQEIPIYVTEILKWEIASNIIWIIVSLLILSLLLATPKSYKKALEKGTGRYGYEWYDTGEGIYCWVVWIASPIVGLSILIPNTLQLVKVLVAPRVYLIEYFTELLK